MSVEKAKEFLKAMSQKGPDDALNKKAADAKTEEEKIALAADIAHDMGIDVTEADIREAIAQIQQEDFAVLDDDMLDGVSGGKRRKHPAAQCPGRSEGLSHKWEKTGNTKPGLIWDDMEYRCMFCGDTKWEW